MTSSVATGTSPRRIALLVETGGPGGAEHVLLNLAEGLRGRGHEIVPIGPDDRSPWLHDQFVVRSFAPERYSMRRLVDWRCVRGIAGILRRRGVDVVHSHEFTMGVYGTVAAKLARRPHVLTMHGGRYYAGKLQRRVALGVAARVSDAVVGVSGACAADLEQTLRLRHGAVRVVPNGVPVPRGDRTKVRAELGLGDADRLLVAVGNLYPVKGHIVLLRALALLVEHGKASGLTVAVAGRGGEEAALREFARQAGIEANVRLLGYRDDAGDILAGADIYAMPSLSEGLPLALLEAMAVGLPVIASRVGGIPEVAIDGENALLVPPGDPAALGSAIERLIGDRALCARLGRAARQTAERDYTLDAMLDRYEAIYAAISGGRR